MNQKISYEGKFAEDEREEGIVRDIIESEASEDKLVSELEEGYREQAKLADEVREALPKRTNKVLCPVCHKKKIAGGHIKACKKTHEFKWFLRNIIKWR